MTTKSAQRQILLFWTPLAASWALMSAEAPILQAAIARLADMETQLAAFGIVMSLEMVIESPVIMLLATSTALCTNAHGYRVVRNFTIALNVFVTAVALLFAFTPLYGFVILSLMRIPPQIAAAALPGMRIMTLWSAAIGTRRFLQGVLIRNGQTRWVGIGTGARLLSSGGTGILLALVSGLPGVHIGSIALMAGVLSEAFFIVVAARSTVRKLLASDAGAAERLSIRDVAAYHLPLAATSLLTLLVQPLIGAGLARMPYPAENLAVWPVIWGILFIFRSTAFALPEAVIALLAQPRMSEPVRVFCYRTGVASSGAMAALTLTPLLGAYLKHMAGIPAHLARFMLPAMLLSIAIPWLNSIHSWFRGVLMAARQTRPIYWGMGLNLMVTAVLVIGGVLLQSPGSESAVVALTLAMLAEVYYLRTRFPQVRAAGS